MYLLPLSANQVIILSVAVSLADMTMRSFAGRISRLFHLRMETRAFNAYHDIFSLRLASKNYLRTRKFLLILYDAGSVLGIVGMFAAVVMLVWTAVSLSSSILLRLTAPHTSTRLLKRAADVTSRAPTSPSGHIVNPIVSRMHVAVRSHLLTFLGAHRSANRYLA